VRTLLSSRLNASRALTIPALAWDFTSAIMALFSFDNSSDLITTNNSLNVASGRQIKHNNRQVIIHAEGRRRRIHDLQPLLEHIQIRQLIIFDSVFIFGGISVIDAVYLGRFKNNLCPNFNSTQAGCGVGGKEWIASTGTKNNHTPFSRCLTALRRM